MVGQVNKVVHCKKERYDIYIGRPSKWGNPFIVGKDGTREEVIDKYEWWVLTQPDLLKDLHELNDKTLGCYCKPLACHGDVLARLAGYCKLCNNSKEVLKIPKRVIGYTSNGETIDEHLIPCPLCCEEI